MGWVGLLVVEAEGEALASSVVEAVSVSCFTASGLGWLFGVLVLSAVDEGVVCGGLCWGWVGFEAAFWAL